MTPEERDRLAKLEQRVEGIDGWMKSIADDVKALRDIANTGNGALKVTLKFGGILTAAVGICIAIYDRIPFHK
jgi:hypothetical protein